MNRSLLFAVLVIAYLALGLPANANDSTARVGAGGLVLLKNDNIRMVQEVLEISTKLIRVRYRFLNETNQDIKATVAFPMPPYGWNYDGEAGANVGPIKEFSISVGGWLVPSTRHRLAMIGGVDVTNRLRKMGLSEAHIFQTFGDCSLEAGKITSCLTKAQEAELTLLSGEKSPVASWQISETEYWEQVFPAGQEIEVEHEYTPLVGMTYGYPYQEHHPVDGNIPWSAVSDSESDSDNDACLDNETRKAIVRRISSLAKKGAPWVAVTLRDVEYILGTGRNWKGPISDFKLTILKESPDQFVSLCFPGKPRRTSSTTVEFSQMNFVPQDKLVVHFYTVKEVKQ